MEKTKILPEIDTVSRILLDLLKEMKALRRDFQMPKPVIDIELCSPKQALAIIGLNDSRYLKYFSEDLKILTRRPGGKSFVYYIKECTLLSSKIKSEDVIVPRIKNLPKTKSKVYERKSDGSNP